jgi:hypothetical protein
VTTLLSEEKAVISPPIAMFPNTKGHPTSGALNRQKDMKLNAAVNLGRAALA